MTSIKRKLDDTELDQVGDQQSDLETLSEASEDDNAPVYDINTEPFPLHPAYYEEAARSQESLEAALDVFDRITSGQISDRSDVKRINEKVVESRKLSAPPTFKIALIGDAGVGKSTLINSLLHIDKIAKTSAAGESCTAVAAEIRKALPDQKQPFKAVVRYREHVEIEEFLRQQILSYQEYHFQDDDRENRKQLEEMRLQAETCQRVLLALCQDHEGFRTVEEIHQSLQQDYDDSQDDTTRLHVTLTGWCVSQLLSKSEDAEGCYDEIEESNLEALQNEIEPFISSDGSGVWPLVKKIIIGVKGNRILDHLTIVDLPGISDSCQVRSNACQDVLRECDALWIVHKIDRIVTEKSVDTLFNTYKERFANRIAVICTRAEDGIDDIQGMKTLADLYRKRGQNMDAFDNLCSQLSDLNRRIKSLSPRKKRAGQQQAEPRELSAELSAARDGITTITTQCFAVVVKARNAFVRGRLQEKHAGLQVFCVSNSHYRDSCKDVQKNNLLSITDSGVPALRDYALTLPADAIWNHLQAYVSGRFQVLLRGLAWWADPKPIQNSAELIKISDEPKERIQDLVSELRDDLEKSTKEKLLDTLYAQVDVLRDAAANLVPIWRRKMFWSSIRAFARRDGKSSARMVAQGSWNEDLLEVVEDKLEEAWGNQSHGRVIAIETFEEELLRLVKTIPTRIRERSDILGPDDMAGVQDLVEGVLCTMLHHVKTFREEHHKEELNIKQDTLQDRHTNFLVRALSNTVYQSSVADRGTGWTDRWRDRFLFWISKTEDDNPFRVWARSTVEAININHRHKTLALENALRKELTEFADQFERRCKGESNDDPATARARAALRDYLPEARTMFKEAKLTMMKLGGQDADSGTNPDAEEEAARDHGVTDGPATAAQQVKVEGQGE